jgi:hypothetical protein
MNVFIISAVVFGFIAVTLIALFCLTAFVVGLSEYDDLNDD